ncbi:uncharacterized protein ACIB01_011608 isoform 6-T6 [Guaruba guarouba]
MRLSLKAFAFSRREKKLPKNGKEEIYHIICLSTGFPLGLWRYAADMENMPSQLDESAQSTQTSCDSTLHALLFLNPAAFFCLRFWMLHIHFPVGLQLKARARTWRMCRQTEGEPREEKPKWIHSLSWMEEERRGEGDVRASFSCLCPVESAQTPGAAPASGSARTFTPSCQSKLSLAATLLWHRHLSVTPVISVPNRRGPHFLLSTLPTTRSFHKAARGACLGEGQSVFVTRE